MVNDFTTLGPDGYVASRTPYYASLYPVLRQAAREHGYALALHGSLTKDLDVLAVPWVEGASDPVTLAHAVCEAAGGFIELRIDLGQNPKQMPHGRLAWTIQLGSNGGYVDLSVMPPRRTT